MRKFESKLAIYGGEAFIKTNFPARKAFSALEEQAVLKVLSHFRDIPDDPSYRGPFESELCQYFSQYMGGGYTVAVATGTASVYVALAALELQKNSEVIISPVTDAGPLNSIILQDLIPVVADSAPNSYNIDWSQIESKITDNTSCIMLVHCGGLPANAEEITQEANKRGIKVLEDCSQAPGAKYNGELVGSFGDIMATSTMYRKNISSPGSGGLIYCKDKSLYHKVLAYSDRGKPLWSKDYVERDPSQHLFPALNWNTNDFSCAVTLASLKRLQDTITKRTESMQSIKQALNNESEICKILDWQGEPSPFFIQVFIDVNKIKCEKIEFCEALLKEGVPLNPNYKFLISDWGWSHQYFQSQPVVTRNANEARDHSFNLYVNEHYTQANTEAIIGAIKKVESYFQI